MKYGNTYYRNKQIIKNEREKRVNDNHIPFYVSKVWKTFYFRY